MCSIPLSFTLTYDVQTQMPSFLWTQAIVIVMHLFIFGRYDAAEVREITPWSILLCKFKDNATEPRNLQFFQTS